MRKKLFLVFVFSFICVPKKNALRSLPRTSEEKCLQTLWTLRRLRMRVEKKTLRRKCQMKCRKSLRFENYAVRNVDLNFFCSKKVICNNSFHARQASPLCQPPSSRNDSRIVLDVCRRSEIMIDTIEKSLFIAKRAINKKIRKLKSPRIEKNFMLRNWLNTTRNHKSKAILIEPLVGKVHSTRGAP